MNNCHPLGHRFKFYHGETEGHCVYCGELRHIDAIAEPPYIHTEGANMTANQYRAALKKLNLSIVGAAPILGISRRQSQRVAAGDSPVPEPVAKLLRLMLDRDIDPKEVK
jgi:hypothetical protein